jgi:hypothetical protein
MEREFTSMSINNKLPVKLSYWWPSLHKEAPPRWSKAHSEWGSLLPRTAQNSLNTNFAQSTFYALE